MFKYLASCLFLGISFFGSSQKMKLNPPVSNISRSFVNKEHILLAYEFRMEGAELWYQNTNQSKPKKYKKPITVKEACEIRAFTKHKDFETSDEQISTFYKKGKKINKANVSNINEHYAKLGSSIIINNELGNLNYTEHYLGFNGDSSYIQLQFKKMEECKEIHVSCLKDHGSWIFLPRMIKVYDGSDRLICTHNIEEAKSKEERSAKAYTISLPKPLFLSELKLVVYPLHEIPKWHDGAGQKAWMFIDEVWVY